MTDYQHSPELGELAKALAKAQADLRTVEKNALNPHFKSKFADLAQIWSSIREVLPKYGLSVVQIPCGAEDKPRLSTILLHESGQWLGGSNGCFAKDGSPQSIGSALTYLRRYGLSALVGVATGDDDDGAAAQPEAPRQPVGKSYQPNSPGPIRPTGSGSNTNSYNAASRPNTGQTSRNP